MTFDITEFYRGSSEAFLKIIRKWQKEYNISDEKVEKDLQDLYEEVPISIKIGLVDQK